MSDVLGPDRGGDDADPIPDLRPDHRDLGLTGNLLYLDSGSCLPCLRILHGLSAAIRTALGLGTGQRNGTAALVIAVRNFPTDYSVVVMIAIFILIGSGAIRMLLAIVCRRTNVRPERRRCIGGDLLSPHFNQSRADP
jgi:hypothetical protein